MTDLRKQNKRLYVQLRRYRILNSLLHNSRKYSFEELLEAVNQQLEMDQLKQISRRTLFNDFRTMEDLFLVKISADKHGHYRYEDTGNYFDEGNLRTYDQFLLEMSLQLFKRYKFTSYYEKFSSMLSRIFAGTILDGLKQGTDLNYIQIAESVEDGGHKWIETVIAAIRDRKCLKTIYHPFGKEEGIRTVSPYALREYRNQWYMVAHAKEKEDDRPYVFRLNRIKKIEEADAPYVSAETCGFDTQNFFKYTLGVYHIHDQAPLEVRLRAKGWVMKLIQERPLHETMRMEQVTSDSMDISIQVYNSPELVSLILGYGPEIEVVAPQDLRAEIALMVTKMHAFYNSKPKG